MAKKKIYKSGSLFSSAEVPVKISDSLATATIEDIDKEDRWIVEELEGSLTQEKLKAVFWTFTGEKLPSTVRKHDLCIQLTVLLTFADQADFDRFFQAFPPVLRYLLVEGCFRYEVAVEPIQKKFGAQILAPRDRHSYYAAELNPAERIHCFELESGSFLVLPSLFRHLIVQWLPKPEGLVVVARAEPSVPVWSNVASLAENLPLLIVSLGPCPGHTNRLNRMRKGFNKSELKSLRTRCGLPLFPSTNPKTTDPIDLVGRLVAALYPKTPTRPEDIDAWVKTTLNRFFLKEKLTDAYTREMDSLTGSALEFHVLCDHLSMSDKWGFEREFIDPFARHNLHAMLLELAAMNGWYSVDDLQHSMEVQGVPATFTTRHFEESNLFIKAESVTVDGYTVKDEYQNRVMITGPLHREAIYRPLMKAYLYLMAIFGVVDFTEKKYAEPVLLNGKKLPLSPYDALDLVKVTEYGKWCLGVLAKKPEREATIFEAIADQNLLLVTFRGKSLERKLFLEEIGEPLGDERYRIGEVSFFRGCKTLSDVDGRIKRFKSLIDKEPAAHWEALFTKVRSRIGLFGTTELALVFDLSSYDPSVRNLFLTDSRLSSLVLRAEQNRIVVTKANWKKFHKLMTENGFLLPDMD